MDIVNILAFKKHKSLIISKTLKKVNIHDNYYMLKAIAIANI